jgi:hypothetical protein
MPRIRIFVSSPGDVPAERLRADLIVDRLSQEYGRFFEIESYRWEHEAMIAARHFQDVIEPPSKFDIVILILWSRLGTPLPEKTDLRAYRGIDDRAPVTGTEWEYEEALRAARASGAPDLLAFRNVSEAPVDPRNPEAQLEQLNALNALGEGISPTVACSWQPTTNLRRSTNSPANSSNRFANSSSGAFGIGTAARVPHPFG